MADVYVESWAEFVEAVGVSGDTVILPEEAEWDMGEILPYGLSSNIIIECSAINGNGTRIKNLNLNSYCFKANSADTKQISDLLMTDWLGTSQWFDIYYDSAFLRCAISGITSYDRVFNYFDRSILPKPTFTSCSINVESSNSTFELIKGRDAQLYYCRWEFHAPNAITINIGGSSNQCCEFIIYAPNATNNRRIVYGTPAIYIRNLGNGNILRGNLKSVVLLDGSTGAVLPTVYSIDTFSEDVTSPDANFIGCTEDQLKDAAYLRSLGFPIAVG